MPMESRFFARPLDAQTIRRQAAIHKGKKPAHSQDEDVDALRYESIARLDSAWTALFDKYVERHATGQADKDDVVDLERWDVVEDRGWLRQQAEEANRTRQAEELRRRLRGSQRESAATCKGEVGGCQVGGDVLEDDWVSESEDELAIPSPQKPVELQTPQAAFRHSEAPVSSRFRLMEQRRAEDLDDLREFLQTERTLRMQPASDCHGQHAAVAWEEEDAEPVWDGRMGNHLAGSRPLQGDDSEDDLDLMKASATNRSPSPQADQASPSPTPKRSPSRTSMAPAAEPGSNQDLPAIDDLPVPSTSAPPSRSDTADSLSKPRPRPVHSPARSSFRCVYIPTVKQEDIPRSLPCQKVPNRTEVVPASPELARGSPTRSTIISRQEAKSPSTRRCDPSPSKRPRIMKRLPSGDHGMHTAEGSCAADDMDELDLLSPTPIKQRRPMTPCTPRTPRRYAGYSGLCQGREFGMEAVPVTPLKALALNVDDCDDIDFLSPSKPSMKLG